MGFCRMASHALTRCFFFFFFFVRGAFFLTLDQQKDRIQQEVVGFASAISLALHATCGFLPKPCHFAIKTRSVSCMSLSLNTEREQLNPVDRHKKSGDHYVKLSFHLTLMAMAPYEVWRQAMQYVERHLFPEMKKKEPAQRVVLLNDLHITNNSKVHMALTLFFFGGERSSPLSPRASSSKPSIAKRLRLDSLPADSAFVCRASISPKERPTTCPACATGTSLPSWPPASRCQYVCPCSVFGRLSTYVTGRAGPLVAPGHH